MAPTWPEVLHLSDLLPARIDKGLSPGLFRFGVEVAQPLGRSHPQPARLVPGKGCDIVRRDAFHGGEPVQALRTLLRVIAKQPGVPGHPNPAGSLLFNHMHMSARWPTLRRQT